MSLCLDCGLCCDGSLFHAVPVTPDEARALTGRVVLDGEKLRQPCGALEGCRCTVYDVRPSTCRTYRCLVLVGFETGRLDEAEARAALAEVFERRAEVVRLVPETRDAREAIQLARAHVAADSASDELRAALSSLNRAALFLQLPPAALAK